MSQRLPTLPNLGYLKKQAKDVLRLSRHRSPQWRLADAQHALARGYGFASWPKLKRHVESVTREPPDNAVGESITAAPAGQRRVRHPIVGTWATRQPTMGDVVVEFELADDTVTLTQIAVDAAGGGSAMKMAIHVDGRDHPIQFGDEYLLQARWTDARTLETLLKLGESIVTKGTYEVSADGQVLVVSTSERVVVFERV